MTKEKDEILVMLTRYLEEHPSIRFGQALFNLDINEFSPNPKHKDDWVLRDIFDDSDTEILKRMKDG